MVPCSRKENELMGAHRDALIHSAKETLRTKMEEISIVVRNQHHKKAA